MVHRSMENGSRVADEVYIKRVLLVLEDFLFFSLYSFSCIASNSTTLKDTLILVPSIRTPSSVPQHPYHLRPTPPVTHCGIKAFWWHITVQAMLRSINEMLGICWLLNQPSHAFDNVSTPVFDRASEIVIPSHILESVLFQLPESLIIWQATHE